MVQLMPFVCVFFFFFNSEKWKGICGGPPTVNISLSILLSFIQQGDNCPIVVENLLTKKCYQAHI